MQTEITSNVELNGTENQGLTLHRVRVDEVKVDREQMPGMDYPAGILLTD